MKQGGNAVSVLTRNPVRQRWMVYLAGYYYSFLASIRLLGQIVSQGPRKIFFVKDRKARPAVLDDPIYGQHHFATLPQNKRLHYVANGDSNKPLMLFLHGFPEFWYSWRHQLKEFRQEFRVVAVDMRGYGESDKPKGVHNYTIDKLVNDVRDFIIALGYDKCYLVAHDWGGGVAWTFAQVYPDMLEKLVVCNMPHTSALAKTLKTSAKQRKMSWYISFFQTPWLPEMMFYSQDMLWLEQMFTPRQKGKTAFLNSDDLEAYKFTFSKLGEITGPMNYYRAFITYQNALPISSKKIQIPTLMIWGTKDMALSIESCEASRGYVTDLQVKYIEGCSHWVQQEEPQLVNKYIREFVLTSPSGPDHDASSSNHFETAPTDKDQELKSSL